MRWVRVLGLLALSLGIVGTAAAQVPAPPTKKIVIYNNSTASDPHTIYPVLIVGARSPVLNASDLWMQAQFVNDFPAVDPYPPFQTTVTSRAYINPDVGIPPGGHVTVTVPFYTQLKAVTTKPVNSGNIGTIPDQFIDWWSGMRIFFFDGANAVNGSMITDAVPTHYPTPIVPYTGAAVPTCVASSGDCKVKLISYLIDPKWMPFQLGEYTFASAEGPPLAPRPAKIDTRWVNYNISSLDNVYLPIAMGPHNAVNPDPGATKYLGNALTIKDQQKRIAKFVSDGRGWPSYFPVYFADPKEYPTYQTLLGAACSLTPFGADKPYFEPEIPGTYNLIVKSYSISIPPDLTSQPPDYAKITDGKCIPTVTPPLVTPQLGQSGRAIVYLWDRCVDQGEKSTVCNEVRLEADFFLHNYAAKCSGTPDMPALMAAAYGWVPIKYNGCTGLDPLVDTPGTPNYTTAITMYCTLQYNYLQGDVRPRDWFNPYTRFIHQVLESSAYAFSIDDETAFRHIIADGVILAIGGTNGLQDKTPSPLPTKDNFRQRCRS